MAVVTQAEVWEKLGTVPDPELPDLSIVDLGMVDHVAIENGMVHVELMPTFVGCPALHWIQDKVEKALAPFPATVEFVYHTPWTTDRMSPQGRERLTAWGVAPPNRSGQPLACPLCGSDQTHRTSEFGPSLCRSIYYCDTCQQPFEAWKTL